MTRSAPPATDVLPWAAGGPGIPAGSDGLVRSTPAELALARSHRDALVTAAAMLVTVAWHDPDVAACGDAGCALDGTGPAGAAICATVHRLARLPDVPPAFEVVSFDAALHGFRLALDGAADAIRACRQTAHPGGGCWFSAAPGTDGCGDILRLLHRCG